MQASQARFAASNAQVLSVNVDHVYSHREYGKSLGGVEFPMLADFHPHGAVTRRYGLWQEEKGFGRRATFVIDGEGIVRWTKIYTSAPPDYEDVLLAVESISR